MDDRQVLGQAGEDAAAAHYEREGYRILARNWRVRAGEIDLVCRRGDTVVFSEVKTRSSGRFGRGLEAVDWRKQRKLRALAVLWLQESAGSFAEIRFDVVEVDRAGAVEVLEGCF